MVQENESPLVITVDELLSTTPWDELLPVASSEELFPLPASLLEEFAEMLEEESPREADVELSLSEQPIIPKRVTLRQRALAPINERLHTFIDPSLNHCLTTSSKHKIKDPRLSIQNVELLCKRNGIRCFVIPVFLLYVYFIVVGTSKNSFSMESAVIHRNSSLLKVAKSVQAAYRDSELVRYHDRGAETDAEGINNIIISHFSLLLLLGLARFHGRKPIFRGTLVFGIAFLNFLGR